MNLILEKKPETIEAFKYEGGAESAEALAVWLKARYPHHVVLWVPPVFDDGKELVNDEVRVLEGRDSIMFVMPGQYVVISTRRGVHVQTETSLFRDFKEVPDEGARPD